MRWVNKEKIIWYMNIMSNGEFVFLNLLYGSIKFFKKIVRIIKIKWESFVIVKFFIIMKFKSL